MYTDYLKELVHQLEATKVLDKNGEAYPDYNVAMQQLIDLFTEIKREGKAGVFYRKWWKCRNCRSHDSGFYEKRWDENLQSV